MIRELSGDDLGAIAEILKAPSEGMTWFSPWSHEQIAEEIVKAWNRGFFENGELAAFIFAREKDEGLEITNLATHPNFRRKGLMMKLIEELIRMRPRSDMWLEVHEANEPAKKLYEGLGFKVLGRRKRYYNDGGSAIVMKREAV